MAEKSTERCPTPKCIEAIDKYGAHYHGVYDKGDHLLCERCGGKRQLDSATWDHCCQICDSTVEPGELVGFFVPHRCKSCDEKVVADERARGDVCRRCNKVYAYCCC